MLLHLNIFYTFFKSSKGTSHPNPPSQGLASDPAQIRHHAVLISIIAVLKLSQGQLKGGKAYFGSWVLVRRACDGNTRQLVVLPSRSGQQGEGLLLQQLLTPF